MKELLQVRHLSKSFPYGSGFFRKTEGAVIVLDDVSFTLQEGE